MDFDLYLKALTGLANSHTQEALDALKHPLQKAQASLRHQTQYDLLEQSLSILEIIEHRFCEEITAEIISFIRGIKTRQITYSNSSELTTFASDIAKYQNSSTLTIRAIEVLLRLRYLATAKITQTLLELSIDEDKEIQASAINGLKATAVYNVDVFYGLDRQGGIGASPQKQMLDLLLGLGDAELVKYQRAALRITESLLSPTVEGTQWSSTAVTISRGAVPASDGVPDIRSGAILVLKRLYAQAQGSSLKLSIIGILNDAARPHYVSTSDEDVSAMITQNSRDVLAFYESLIANAEFQIVQKVETLSYWIYFHALNETIKSCALAIEKAVAANLEYQTYKTLIGFEGIFQSWEQLRKNDNYWEETDKFRKNKATEFANSITPENFPMWRERVLLYSRTESNDLATFPIFYHFLETFAVSRPQLALKLISDDSDEIARFLIPLLRGLWSGPEQSAIRKILNAWISAGRHLHASTKQFLDCPTLDLELVKHLLNRAAELNDLQTVALVMTVAASNYKDDDSLVRDLFIPALEVLTNCGDPQWIFDLWFHREMRVVISKLNDHDTDLILRNLMFLEKIDYRAEEILFLIAQRTPQVVLKFLCQRLTAEKEGKVRHKTYDAIPFTLHKLYEPLATIPNAAVQIVRAQYDGDYGMFVFRGAHLLKIIFPEFSIDFETELLNLVEEGGDENLLFVLAVLRNYEGQPFIHNVCKAIVTKISPDSEFQSEVYVALRNTGIVSGEYGFSEAYERKKSEILEWLNDPNEKVKIFAAWYIEKLDRMIIADRQRADEEIALRKQRFNE
jgi:hypothetical protein